MKFRNCASLHTYKTCNKVDVLTIIGGTDLYQYKCWTPVEKGTYLNGLRAFYWKRYVAYCQWVLECLLRYSSDKKVIFYSH